MKLAGSITYRKPKGEYAYCGIKFEWDWSKTEKFELQESVIGAFLMRQQRDTDGKPSSVIKSAGSKPRPKITGENSSMGHERMSMRVT